MLLTNLPLLYVYVVVGFVILKQMCRFHCTLNITDDNIAYIIHSIRMASALYI